MLLIYSAYWNKGGNRLLKIVQINYDGVDSNLEYEQTINRVAETCFEEENLNVKNLYLNIILTTPTKIREINNQYRNIDKETDVLSFPMFEKDEIPNINSNIQEVLGDIIISVDRVKEQANEYGHSFTRELAYMVVHGFYHLMGYDHIEEKDKQQMRKKEELILNKLNITRE